MPTRHKPPAEIARLNHRAFSHGIYITEALTRAGVAGSTWTRCRDGKLSVNPEIVSKIDTALDGLIAESTFLNS